MFRKVALALCYRRDKPELTPSWAAGRTGEVSTKHLGRRGWWGNEVGMGRPGVGVGRAVSCQRRGGNFIFNCNTYFVVFLPSRTQVYSFTREANTLTTAKSCPKFCFDHSLTGCAGSQTPEKIRHEKCTVMTMTTDDGCNLESSPFP